MTITAVAGFSLSTYATGLSSTINITNEAVFVGYELGGTYNIDYFLEFWNPQENPTPYWDNWNTETWNTERFFSFNGPPYDPTVANAQFSFSVPSGGVYLRVRQICTAVEFEDTAYQYFIIGAGADAPRDNTVGVDENTLFIPIDEVNDIQFAAIRNRGVTNSIPTKVLDNGGYPNRQLYFWPVPNTDTVAIELWLWEPLEIIDLNTDLNLPKGYERYLIYSLAVELSDIFGKQVTPEIVSSQNEAADIIKTLNQLPFQANASKSAKQLSRRGRSANYIDFITGINVLPTESK